MENRIPVSKNFFLDEFIDPYTYYKEDNRGLNQTHIIDVAQFVRNVFGKAMTINNWWTAWQAGKMKTWGHEQAPAGVHTFRGFRPDSAEFAAFYPGGITVPGAPHSAHKMGKAFDFNIAGLTIQEIHEFIMHNQGIFYDAGIRRMESIIDAPTWIHLDTVETGQSGIHVFRA